MKTRSKPLGTVTVPAGEWPKCECGNRAVFALGRERQPVCEDGLQVWRETGDRRVVKKLVPATR